MHAMKWLLTVVSVVAMSGCASGTSGARDPQPSMPFAWCADEAQAAASQPMPRDVSREQREANRDYHMSKACQRALEQKAEIRFPATPSPRP